jgi:UDP-glucose 4-epimerase
LRDKTVLKREEPQIGFQRILVTGGAGFIGSHLVDVLTSRGCKVTILDNLSTGTLKNIENHLNNEDAALVEGDVRNMREVKEALRGVDAVFHLAAITSVPYSVKNPKMTNEVNAEGTRNLLEASVDSNVKCFVYASTCSIYGDPQYLPIDEDHPINPISPYAESKLRGEGHCSEFRERHGLNTVTLRLFNVYGPRQSDNEYSGVILKFVKQIGGGNPPVIYGDGQQTRDFVHVRDVIEALLLSANNDKAIGQTFNIGSGKPITIGELCQLILRKFKVEMEPIYREPRLGDIKRSFANIQKAQKILGYKPEIPLEEGLQEIMQQQVQGFG